MRTAAASVLRSLSTEDARAIQGTTGNVHVAFERQERVAVSVRQALQVGAPRARQGNDVGVEAAQQQLRDGESEAPAVKHDQRWRETDSDGRARTWTPR